MRSSLLFDVLLGQHFSLMFGWDGMSKVAGGFWRTCEFSSTESGDDCIISG